MTHLRHTVLMRFKPDATEEQIQAVLDGLATMPEKMEFIRRYEFGRDVGMGRRSIPAFMAPYLAP